MADNNQLRRAKALRDFTDAGTERTFAQGKVYDLTHGEYANFAAGGLVGEPDFEEPADPAG